MINTTKDHRINWEDWNLKVAIFFMLFLIAVLLTIAIIAFGNK